MTRSTARRGARARLGSVLLFTRLRQETPASQPGFVFRPQPLAMSPTIGHTASARHSDECRPEKGDRRRWARYRVPTRFCPGQCTVPFSDSSPPSHKSRSRRAIVRVNVSMPSLKVLVLNSLWSPAGATCVAASSRVEPERARGIAACIGALYDAGRAASSAAMMVAALRFRARLAGRPSPTGPAVERALAGFRRQARDRGRGQAPAMTADDLAAITRARAAAASRRRPSSSANLRSASQSCGLAGTGRLRSASATAGADSSAFLISP